MKLSILCAAALCLTLVSCNKINDDANTKLAIQPSLSAITTSQIPLETQSAGKLTAGQATVVQSKLNNDFSEFTVSDEIGLFGVEWEGAETGKQTQGSMEPSGNIIDNHVYKNEGSGNGWSSSALANSLTYRKISFYAYYPYRRTITDALNHELTFSDTQGVVQSDNFFIWGDAPKNSEGYEPLVSEDPIVINFQHQMAVVNFVVKIPVVYLSQSVTGIVKAEVVNIAQSAKFNLATGVMTQTGKQNKVMYKISENNTGGVHTATFEAVVPPTLYDKGNVILKVTYNTANGEEVLQLNAPTAGYAFDKAHRYNFDVTAQYEFMFKNNGSHLSSIPQAGGNYTFDIVSSDPSVTSWEVVADANLAGWTTLTGATSPSGGGNKSNISIRIAANATGASRMGTLILKDTTPNSTRPDVVLVVTQLK